MHSIVKIAVCLALATIIEAKPNNVAIQAEQSLVRLLLETQSSGVSSQARMSCFDQYAPDFEKLFDVWQKSHSACLTKGETERTELDKSTVDDRAKIQEKSNDSCAALAACKGNEHSMQYFTCTDEAGKNNTHVMYDISTNSQDVISRIKAKSIEIDQNEQKCTTNAERTYHDEQSKVYDKITKCLNGKN